MAEQPKKRNKRTALERAENAVATTERLIARNEKKLARAKAEVSELEDHLADLQARLEYERMNPALPDRFGVDTEPEIDESYMDDASASA